MYWNSVRPPRSTSGVVLSNKYWFDTTGFLLGRGDVAVGLEIAAGEFRFQLDAFIIALRVIERAQNQRLAKISVVEQVGRDLVLGVDPDFESAAVALLRGSLAVHQRCQRAASQRYLLGHAGIEIMRPLGQHRILKKLGWRTGRVPEQGDIGRGGLHEHRWCEVARVAGMPCRAIKRLVGETDARAQPVGASYWYIWSKRRPAFIVS